jgi:hypothetical protein
MEYTTPELRTMEYTSPVLRNLGSLATLTLGGNGSALDGFGGQFRINLPGTTGNF